MMERRSDRPEQTTLRRLRTDELAPAEVAAIRALMTDAFGDEEEERFTDHDWAHAIGGMHVVLDIDRRIVAHASLVEREIQVGGRRLRTGYVEAVATAPDRQGRGIGTIVMRAIDELIRDGFELGVLGTGSQHFYERLGWRSWLGRSAVRTADGLRPTPDDDGYLMVLDTPASPDLDLSAPISCEWRPGDVW
jgi:aminoglycoside 2'-N-acetyltransferase I